MHSVLSEISDKFFIVNTETGDVHKDLSQLQYD